MTNVSATANKIARRRALFHLGEQALEREGWKVSRVPGGGKSSLRQVTRGNERKLVSIRTTQDTWFAFPKKPGGKGWVTLDDVDIVVAASVNDYHNPTEGRAHIIPGDVARDRFNRAYDARAEALHTQPDGRGIWISLYDAETAGGPVANVGGGLGLEYPAVLTLDLTKDSAISASPTKSAAAPIPAVTGPSHRADWQLTIPEAKRRLAQSLGVPEDAIRITVEH